MPFFSSIKFSPKRTPARKISSNSKKTKGKDEESLKLEGGPIKIKLGSQETTFQEGDWIPESGPIGGKFKENQKLAKQVQQLEEENNLLRLKMEVLLDMLTETTAEAHIQDKEISRLRHEVARSCKS